MALFEGSTTIPLVPSIYSRCWEKLTLGWCVWSSWTRFCAKFCATIILRSSGQEGVSNFFKGCPKLNTMINPKSLLNMTMGTKYGNYRRKVPIVDCCKASRFGVLLHASEFTRSISKSRRLRRQNIQSGEAYGIIIVVIGLSSRRAL